MTVLDVLNELDTDGKLQLYVKAKIIKDKDYFYREIASIVFHKISTGHKRMDIYAEMSEQYGVSELTIINACNRMKEKVSYHKNL
jgi:hypothetical protein